MSTTRRPWKPPRPPTPKILHLPRRTRRKATKQVGVGKFIPVRKLDSLSNHREKLETLFNQERSFCHTVPVNTGDSDESERRGRVEDFDFGYGEKGQDLEDEKWRFQAEILRAECKFLRMEREIALKKLEKSRVQMERTLRSAVETLISGRKRIYEGKNVGVALEEEIEDLEEKLEELQRRCPGGVKDFDVQKCRNFDKQTTILQRRLEKLGGISEEESVKEIREIAEASLSINTNCRSIDSSVSNRKTRFTDMENLGRKMEGLSKKMLEKMEEEYKSMVSITTSSTSNSVSSSRRVEFPDTDPSPIIRPHHPQGRTETVCSGRCKSTVRKLVEQVRAETEQWTQMQEMLGQVREDTEELQASRDFWEDRACHCGDRIRSLHTTEQRWKQKALSSENMVTKLQKQISDLHVELERLRSKPEKKPTRDTQKEKEKRVLICRLKENHQIGSSCNIGKQNKAHSCSNGLVTARNRSPLQDIGNSSPLNNQSSIPLKLP